MSKKLQLSRRGQNENDEDSDIATIKHFHHEEDENDEESSTKQRQNRDINEVAEATVKKPKAQDIISRIDTYDRPTTCDRSVTYGRYARHVRSATYARPTNIIAEGGLDAKQGIYFKSYIPGFEEITGKNIGEDGVGQARPENPLFEAVVKGPSASAGTEVSVVKVEAMARAEVASASASVGPVGVKVGLGFDTGASAGLDGVEAKFLGTGFSIGQKNSISVLGSEASCSVM
ncbi:uncharacterized protein LOC113055709 [Carassius auratus]|uniref:Uncharacterized protein LOC113055709 n=1 Tax=Carassius auratus TaxID=7957 RepID=A0A6P6L032_CARAU|nr:uncharacterized protein LOC113055709 [Carassius auratus]